MRSRCAVRARPSSSRRFRWATLPLAEGVPDRVIMDVLGHAEIGVTMNAYAHVLPVLRRRRLTPSMSCSEPEVMVFGSSAGSGKGHVRIGGGEPDHARSLRPHQPTSSTSFPRT
jgi:hypothetical protein